MNLDLVIDQLQIENAFLNNKINYLKEQLTWFKRQVFDKRSERIVSNLSTQQLEFEGYETPSHEEGKKSVAAHSRANAMLEAQDKITLPLDLPVETVIIDVPVGIFLYRSNRSPSLASCIEKLHCSVFLFIQNVPI